MKKNIIILLLLTLFLTGCGDTKEKTQKTDYSNYSFTDITWTRDAESDEETIIFKSNGSFTAPTSVHFFN